MHRITRAGCQQGQALSETLIALPVLVSILLLGATLYQMLDADLVASKAARLATWSSTLAVQQSEAEITQRVWDTLYIKDKSTNEIDNARDFGADNGGSKTLTTLLTEADIGLKQLPAVRPFPANQITNSSASRLGTMAGIDNVGITPLQISIPLDSNSSVFKYFHSGTYMLRSRRGGGKDDLSVKMDVPLDEVTEEPRFNVRGQGAILASAFTPMGESTFSQNVESIAADVDSLGAMQILRGTLFGLGLQETNQLLTDEGLTTTSELQSRILPPELGTFTP